MEEFESQPVISMDELLEAAPEPVSLEQSQLRAVLEALVYVTEEPLTVAQMASVLQQPADRVRAALKSPLKLSLPALETLAVIAYKQPVTAPEIMEIRGVQGAGVLKTLLDRKLIATAGRKDVIGKPILYKTTKDFLVQFGLKDLAELPSLKEFEEIRRLAFAESEPPASEPPCEPDAAGEPPAPEA